jgi:hypothetical protein
MEILPSQSFKIFSLNYWIATLITTILYPILLERDTKVEGTYFFFFTISVIITIFVFRNMVETKNAKDETQIFNRFHYKPNIDSIPLNTSPNKSHNK